MRRPKALFLSYFTYAPLIQLNRSDTLRDLPNFEGLSGFVENKTSLWWMIGYKWGRYWPKKARCSSREVSADGCLWVRASITEEDLVHVCLSRSSWTPVEASGGSSLSMVNRYMFWRVSIGNWSKMGDVEGN